MALRFRGLDAPVEVQYWKGGSAPVPDPNVQVAAESNANRYNTTGPGGTSTWTQGPRIVTGYDQNGKPIFGQQATQTTTLSPEQQKQYDIRNQIADTMLSGASGQVGALSGTPYSSGARFDYNAATPDAAKAAYSRQVALLQPEFDKADRTFEQRMANAGIPVGSEAYNDAMRQHENDKNFALTDAASQAEQEGAGMAFQQHEANLQQGLSERQQQYNELAAALGGQQLSPVSAFAPGGGAPLNVSGAYQSANNAALAKYNAQQASADQTTGALEGLGTTAAMAFMMY